VSIEDGLNAGVSGWGWQDDAYGRLGAPIYFASSGPQRIRVQVREDGLSIDQIVLSPSTYATSAPGATRNDTTILARSASGNPHEIVLYAADSSTVVGNWSRVADTAAASGYALLNPNLDAPKLIVPLAAPPSYFELVFDARRNVPYHLWIRGKAAGNSWSNDSIYVQFSTAVSALGAPLNRIGTTSAATVSIEDGLHAGLAGWGWQDNAYGSLAPPMYFEADGPVVVRIQPREDGISIDQIVLSAGTFLTTAPGSAMNDRTILPR
jgi:hypothetical protein